MISFAYSHQSQKCWDVVKNTDDGGAMKKCFGPAGPKVQSSFGMNEMLLNLLADFIIVLCILCYSK